MDIKTMDLPAVSVFKGSRIWAYSDHRNHWKLVKSSPESVTICHASRGGELTIAAPDRVLVLVNDEGKSRMQEITGEVA